MMLKILVGVGLGFLIFIRPEARQTTGDLPPSAGDAIAPAKDGKIFQDIVLMLLLKRAKNKSESASTDDLVSSHASNGRATRHPLPWAEHC